MHLQPLADLGQRQRARRASSVSSTSASYRLKVIPYGRSIASSSAIRIWCARMIEVTARIAA